MKGLTAAFLVTTMSLAAESQRFYVGTYTKGTESEGIYTGELDTRTGALSGLRVAGRAVNPSFLALAPDDSTLYAVMEAQGGAVGAFAVAPDGSLEVRNHQPSGGEGPCHLAVTPSGRQVLVANYSGGSVTGFPVNPDGSVGAVNASVVFTGSGPHPHRQKKPYGHGIVTDPEGRFAYVCDLGSDRVWSFRLGADTGSLTPTEPDAGMVPPGGGPRHIVLHPNGRFAYTNNEMALSVTTFRRDPDAGTLTAFQTVPTSETLTGPVGGVTTAEIVIHPTGRWLYVSSRGDDIIAVYDIAADGSLTLRQNCPAGVVVPRGMGMDPSGRWMIVAGQKDNRLATLAIDPTTGRLTASGHTAEVPAPVCVIFTRP
jgi:6-phosphogluconolactonase